MPTPEQVTAQKKRRRLEMEAMAMSNEPEQKGESAGRRAGERFNKGVIDLIAAPTDLVNAGIRFATQAVSPYDIPDEMIPQIPNEFSSGSAFRENLAESGVIPPDDQRAEGILENTAEIVGAGILPHIGITAKGNQILNQSIKQMQNMGILRNMAASTAARPGAAAAGELAASAGAATGRTIAEDNNASPSVQIMAELLGGFTPAAVLGAGKIAYNVSFMRSIATSIKENLFPFTKAGAWPKASRRLRELVANPEDVAQRIDVDSSISPARQTGEDDLLALEQAVYRKDPDAALAAQKDIVQTKEALKQEAVGFFGGDSARPRELLKKGKQYLLDMLDMRTAQSSAELEARLSTLTPDATPREINRITREVVDGAYKDARTTEKQLWDSIDVAAPVTPEKGRTVLVSEISKRSRFADPEEIPGWLNKALGPEEIDPKLEAQLKKAGAIDSNGQFVPGMRERLVNEGIIQEQGFTFNEVKDIRSRVLREMRVEGAKEAPNRNKIRILDDIQAGLLDDLGESGVENADAARDFSLALNERFTRGQVGKLFGHDRTGGARITPETTLDAMLGMRDSAASIQQIIKASPEARPMIRDYLASEFIAATDAGKNSKAAQRFIEKWDRRGAFNEFPDLKDELQQVKGLSDQAKRAADRANKARTFASKSGKSTAAIYLDTDPGDEMAAILKSKRPAAAARKIRAKMGGDAEAEKGLRTHFLEEGFKAAETNNFYTSGEPIYSGSKFTKFLANNREVAKALGVTDIEWQRLENIALKMRQLEATPGMRIDKIVDDAPNTILDLAAGYIGAQQGGKVGNSMGSSLVMAGAFSKRARGILDKLNKNTATKMLIDAHRDPKLYRALLVMPDAPIPKQDAAAQTIQNWLVGIGATTEDED